MQLTSNFHIKEFMCRDGTPVPLDLLLNVSELAANLQVLRDYYQKPIHINSGYRTKAYNKTIGGAPKSQHLLAKAADIRINGVTPKQLHTTILELIEQRKIKNGGVGLYNSFVHYDVRDTPARWDYSS